MTLNVVARNSLSTLTSRCDTINRAYQIAKIYLNSGYSDVTVRDLNTGQVYNDFRTSEIVRTLAGHRQARLDLKDISGPPT